ncbi:MAG TPA: tetratricopeptide repeat protein [Actinomycetota bacterium]|nr:tetratricopeptide repeat protein [Actinomycetota bacterium]
MNIRTRLVTPLVALMLAAAACSPPAALKDALGKDSSAEGDGIGSAISPDDFPAPEAPGEPADARIGALVLTNESSWGLFLDRGEESTGSLVLEVLPDSPAQQIGLRPGDVITWLDGSDITNHEQLLTIFRKSRTNQHTLRVTRADGSTEQIETELAPSNGFSMLSYLENKLATAPDPITRYLLAENLPDRDRGIEMIRGLLAEHPEFAEGHALLARLLIDRVNRITGGGTAVGDTSPDLVDATQAIDTAVELDSESASLLRARSQILLALGDPAKAEIDAEKALELDEDSAESHFLLGTSQLSLSRPDDAIAHLHRAVELDPYVFDYYVNLALCYRALGREPDAETTVFAARSLAGDDPVLRQRLDELLTSSDSTQAE